MLTDSELKCLKPGPKTYKVTDRDGMYVVVTPKGTKTFRYDYRINKRRETLTRLRHISVNANIVETIATMLGQKWQGSEDAQVIAGSAGSEADVYMYLCANEFKPWADYTEKETKHIIHFMHREFAHVHNITLRYRAFGEKVLTGTLPGISAYLAPIALNLWNDYAVARLSAPTMPDGKVITFIPQVAKTKAESELAVAAAIKAYRTHANLNLLMGTAARHIQDYLGAIAEAVGYADGGNPVFQNAIADGMKAVAGPSHAQIIGNYIPALRRMWRYYPVWEDFGIYDDLVYAVRAVEFSWGIAMRDHGKSVHVAVP